ncbi:MAG: hypothetical protein E7576_16955 [Ruminococcaceae bacterium]|jgi:hypothetical protein|nr:hypothetical protein [Oscillospiraceae bacterium]
MTTLYLSDLDGTLLDPAARLPEEDAERINRMAAAGVKISFATARTVRSVSSILRSVDFSLPGCAPVALMNGTMIRDMRAGRYLSVEKIPSDAALRVLGALDSTGAEPFVYTVDEARPVMGDPLLTSYRELKNDAMRRFMDERIERYGKPFLRFASPSELTGETVYFCVLGGEDLIRSSAVAAEGIPGIRLTYYRDAYRPEVWYLEIFSETASKSRAAAFLRAFTGADRVVSFGDNRNDLPMFEASDVSVAVSSAQEEVRSAADAVCENVTEFILRDLAAQGIRL